MSVKDATRTTLVALVVAALVLRLGWAVWLTGAIENEGAEYARIAQNLRSGVGYVGIATPGPEVIFPPLYPLLIAALSFLTRDFEWAARLVSVVAGAFLILPMFGIASRLFDRRTGLIAALLTCVHPFMVNLAATTFSETLYMTLLLGGVLFVLRALDEPSSGRWCVVGGTLGLAYLTRPEALGTLVIALIACLVRRNPAPRLRIRFALAAAGLFAVLVAPYAAFLYQSTGQLRLEGKSPVHLVHGKRILAGQSTHEAEYSINDKLEGTGLWMRPVVELVRETPMEPTVMVHVMAAAIRQNAPRLVKVLSDWWLGGPLLLALAAMGLFRRPWRRATATSSLFVVLTAAVCFQGASTPQFRYYRFAFVLAPFLLLWGAEGLVQVFHWAKGSAGAFGATRRGRFAVGAGVSLMLGLVVGLLSLRGISYLDEFEQGSRKSRVVEQVAALIRARQNEPITIMDSTTQLSFHAGARWIHFPYTDGQSAVRFLDVAKVDYVVIRSGFRAWDYYTEWFDKGIPHPRAELIYASSDPYYGGLKVFRWHRDDG